MTTKELVNVLVGGVLVISGFAACIVGQVVVGVVFSLYGTYLINAK